VRDALHVEFPPMELFRATTVADQAATLLRLGLAANPDAELARLLDESEVAPDGTETNGGPAPPRPTTEGQSQSASDLR
jgi:hypothetical protein